MKTGLAIKAVAVVIVALLGVWAWSRFAGSEEPPAVVQTETEPGPAPKPSEKEAPIIRPVARIPASAPAPSVYDPVVCLAKMTGLSFTNSNARTASMRTVIQQLENLVEIGPAAIPAIQQVLMTQKDSYFPGRSDGLAPASLRMGLYDVLRRIGGADAEFVLASMLSRTESGFELRHLAGVLETVAPGKYREGIITAGRELAAKAMAGTDDSSRRERELAYDLLGRSGDQSLVAKAQADLISGSGRLDRTALRYLERAMGDASIPVIQQALADPRLTHEDSREDLVESLRDRMQQSPEAVRALQQIAGNTSLGRRERDEAFDALSRAGDTSLVDVARGSLVTENGRVNESVLRYLERATGDAVLADVARVWGDPRVQNQQEREELVQAIVSRVGLNDSATQMWQEIAANSQMPANLREEAIGELDDRGLNRRNPSEQDRRVAEARMRLLEQVAPHLQDQRLAARAERVYRDLTAIVNRPPSTQR